MKKQNINSEINKEQLSQKALGNIDIDLNAVDNNDELKSTPKTTGTGGNAASSTPNSLIVHEDRDDENRYDNGENKKTK